MYWCSKLVYTCSIHIIEFVQSWRSAYFSVYSFSFFPSALDFCAHAVWITSNYIIESMDELRFTLHVCDLEKSLKGVIFHSSKLVMTYKVFKNNHLGNVTSLRVKDKSWYIFDVNSYTSTLYRFYSFISKAVIFIVLLYWFARRFIWKVGSA